MARFVVFLPTRDNRKTLRCAVHILSAAAATSILPCEMRKNAGPAGDIVVNPDPRWTCGECGRTFTRRYSMLLHIRQIHEAPYTLLDSDRRIGNPSWDTPE